jgi:Uma2 family endonuclease
MSTLTHAKGLAPESDYAASDETLADLLHRLGDIPAGRVRLHPFPGTATDKDVLAIEAHEDRLFELVDGILVEKAMGYWESRVGFLIGLELGLWNRSRNLGLIVGVDGMMRVVPNQVRMPDVSFTTPARFPGGKPTPGPIPEIAPDLAVEVISEGNTEREIERKRKEYFQGGTLLVWEVDPRKRTVVVYSSPEHFKVLGPKDVLDGGTLLPEFSLPLANLFAELPDDYK